MLREFAQLITATTAFIGVRPLRVEMDVPEPA